jgi:hypothetical protein
MNNITLILVGMDDEEEEEDGRTQNQNSQHNFSLPFI